jgi:Dyp-type peroxidase family
MTPLFILPHSATALVQFDMDVEGSLGISDYIHALDFSLTEIVQRWTLAVGPKLFDRCPELKRPQLLFDPLLNGDAEVGLMPGDGGSEFLCILDGSWEEILSAVQVLCGILGRLSARRIRAHIGYGQESVRDHSGFIDGTSNLQELTEAQLEECIMVTESDDSIYAGGSYLLFRKFEEDLEMWNDLPEAVQEQLIGREKSSGSYLDGTHTWSSSAELATLVNAHIRCVRPRKRDTGSPDWWQDRMYRRSVKFTEPKEGGIIHGLLFLSVLRNPEKQFARIYNECVVPREGNGDLLIVAGYTKPVLSCIYFVPTRGGLEIMGGAFVRQK